MPAIFVSHSKSNRRIWLPKKNTPNPSHPSIPPKRENRENVKTVKIVKPIGCEIVKIIHWPPKNELAMKIKNQGRWGDGFGFGSRIGS
jgi:hypothetical protein